MTTTSALRRWQDLERLTDDQAAKALGLELGEFRRQRTVGASRQSALLALLISLYQPNLELIAATAATLDHRPEQSCREPG
jgi:hypothetical protein